MAPRTKKSSSRIVSKTTLTKAIELISSEEIRDTSRKPIKVSYKINPSAAKILLRIAAKDISLGWQVLYGCDTMSLYGHQIVMAYEGYCASNEQAFEFCCSQQNRDMIQYVDRQGKTN